jgi:hypothetical protein
MFTKEISIEYPSIISKTIIRPGETQTDSGVPQLACCIISERIKIK